MRMFWDIVGIVSKNKPDELDPTLKTWRLPWVRCRPTR
jgi:hypothetical protein